jgi:hypothetical protein
MLRHTFIVPSIVFKWLSIGDNPTVLAYILVVAKVSLLWEFRGFLNSVKVFVLLA